jgi:hypothetical protein
MSTLSHSRHSRGCYEQERCNQKPAIWLRAHVRFGSEADICSATSDVRFTPDSDHESGPPRKVMSALPLKADICSARGHVRNGP